MTEKIINYLAVAGVAALLVVGWFSLDKAGYESSGRATYRDERNLIVHINQHYRQGERILVDGYSLHNDFGAWRYNQTQSPVEIMNTGIIAASRDNEPTAPLDYNSIRPFTVVWLIRRGETNAPLPDNWRPLDEELRFGKYTLRQYLVTQQHPTLLSRRLMRSVASSKTSLSAVQ